MVSGSAPNILIADDQPDVLESLRLLLKGEGYRTEPARSPAAILKALESEEFDALRDHRTEHTQVRREE